MSTMAIRAILEGFRIGLENWKKQLEEDAKKGDPVAMALLEGWNKNKKKITLFENQSLSIFQYTGRILYERGKKHFAFYLILRKPQKLRPSSQSPRAEARALP